MEQSKREIQLKFRVSEEEQERIETRMADLGVVNKAAFYRKMALDGYIVKLNLTEIRELISLLRRISGNINQIAKRVNSTGRIYETELEEIREQQEMIWGAVKNILHKLSILR